MEWLVGVRFSVGVEWGDGFVERSPRENLEDIECGFRNCAAVMEIEGTVATSCQK